MTDPHDLERFNPVAVRIGSAYVVSILFQGEPFPLYIDDQPTAADAKLEAIRRFRAVIDPSPIEGEDA